MNFVVFKRERERERDRERERERRERERERGERSHLLLLSHLLVLIHFALTRDALAWPGPAGPESHGPAWPGNIYMTWEMHGPA